MKRCPKTWLPLSLGLVVGCADEETQIEPELGSTVYVDEAAAEGGDGSALRPLRTVREAFEVERPFDAVVIAAGDYPVPSPFAFDAPLDITGAEGFATRLRVEAGGDRIDWSAGVLALASLAIAAPLDYRDGELELEDVEVSDVVGPALALSDATASFVRVDVSGVNEVVDQEGSGDGIDVSGGTLSWDGGGASSVPDRALVLRGAEATLDGLSLTSAQRAPLTVIEGSQVTASSITVDDVTVAVYVRSGQLDLVGATISNGRTAGLLLSGDSTTRVVDSTLSDCPQGHVALIGSGANLEMERNTLTNASMSPCVLASQTDGTVAIRDNLLDGCAGAGISVASITGALIEGNDIKNITPDPMFPELADGITLLDGEATISDNVVSDTAGYGISLIRSYGTIAGNTIGPTASLGISIVEQAAHAAVVSLNTITAAHGAGVMVLEASAELDGNTISGTTYSPTEGLGDGIAFALGADVVATGNDISANALNGIVFLDGVSGELTGNTLNDNTWYGIREFCTGPANTVTIANNTMSNNGAGPTDLCSP